jgi:uncharacterized membrane protein HdeD (DUF308 family)
LYSNPVRTKALITNSPLAHWQSGLNGKTLLGITFALAVVGAVLAIFGVAYTVSPSCASGNVFNVYPIWSIPLSGCVQTGLYPSLVFVSANYTLNYVGIAIILVAIAIPIALWTSRPHMRTTQTKGTMLGLACISAIIGAILLTSTEMSTISANYTINYVGFAILIVAAATLFASTKLKPHSQAVASTTA